MGHAYIDHTSEITLRVESPTFVELVADATRGLAELASEALEARETEVREFRIRGRDRAAMLVEWLNEMVYLSEAEQWLPVEAEVTQEGPTELLIRSGGVRLAEPWVLVKAATLHRAAITESAEGLVAEVTLDI